MQKALKSLFSNRIIFIIFVVLGVACNILMFLGYAMGNCLRITAIMEAGCLAALLPSCREDRKNVVSSLLGALMMKTILSCAEYLQYMTTQNDLFCVPMLTFLSVILLINHLLISWDEQQNSLHICVNQMLTLGLVALNIFWNLSSLQDGTTLLGRIVLILDIVCFICKSFAILCAELSLDVRGAEPAEFPEEE